MPSLVLLTLFQLPRMQMWWTELEEPHWTRRWPWAQMPCTGDTDVPSWEPGSLLTSYSHHFSLGLPTSGSREADFYAVKTTLYLGKHEILIVIPITSLSLTLSSWVSGSYVEIITAHFLVGILKVPENYHLQAELITSFHFSPRPACTVFGILPPVLLFKESPCGCPRSLLFLSLHI